MHPDMWYHLNVIRHHDGCRLVHPAKWDISSMSYVIITDVDWCIPPSGTLDKFQGAFVIDADWCISSDGLFYISFQFKMSEIDRFVRNSIYHSHSFDFQIPHFNSIFTFVSSFQIYTQSMYSFHILIHRLIHILIHILIYVLISYLLGKLPKYLK